MKRDLSWKSVWLRAAVQCMATALLCGTAFGAGPQLVWRIGEFNASSGEFHTHDLDYANPKSDAIFRVGTSTNRDWPRFQPGPANGTAGGRLHPFTILFDLPEQPSGVYQLKLAMLYETPRLSHLKLEVNGHSGLFYFHPKLDYAAGDWEGTFVPQASTDSKTIAIPAAWLKQGENRFVLTALDDPADVQHSIGSIAPGHTGLVYDALELTHNPSGRYERSRVTATVEPTIFYRSRGGKPQEVVDVIVDSASARVNAAELAVGGQKTRVVLNDANDFGERKVAIEIPEWVGEAHASLRLETSAGTRVIQSKVVAAKKWNVLVVPHEHLDIGFTDYPAKVAELHAQSIDGAMSIMRGRPEFRWTLDGAWVANQYLEARSTAAQQRFLERVRKGDIVIPPEFANQHTGNASLEGLIRALYDGHQLALKYDLPRPLAAQTVDVPSYTWSLASVLHDAGIKYFVGASNSWRAPSLLLGRWNEKSPFYWEGPDGGRVLMWYARAYLQMHTLFGSPWRMEAVHDALPVFLQAYTRPDYEASSVVIFGSQLENTPLAKEQAELQSSWNAEYSYPRIEFSTVQSALQQIEKEAGGRFPVYRGDLGPYWEDGYGSDSAHTAIHRENQERILTAEKLAVLPSLLSPTLRPDLSKLKQAWANELMYDEHTWTYVAATTQPEHQQSEDQIALKRSRVVEARHEIDESIQRGFAQLSSLLAPQQNSIAVMNSLNWARSGLVEFDLQDGTEIFDGIAAQVVPYEVLFVGKGIQLPGFGSGYRRVRFEARDVPALGYKLYSLRPTTAATASVAAAAGGETIESRFYRLVIDASSGGIKSLVDKETGKELVDQASPYRLGAFLYVTGGDDIPNNSLYRFGAGLNPPKLDVHPAADGKLDAIRKTPFGTVIVLSSAARNTPTIRTEITLYDNEKRIDLRYDIHKDRDLHRESAYIAFPWKAERPWFAYSTQTAWVNPAIDELPGGSREWYVARRWTTVGAPDAAITIAPVDAPLVAFGDIVRGNWPERFAPKTSTVFSWLMNNYWATNFLAWQGGDFTFRYAITSAPVFDAAATGRFGSEALTPLEATAVPAATGPSILPATKASMLRVEGASVELSTWKVAEDGDGSILRLQETAGKAATVRVGSEYIAFDRAWLASGTEDNRSEITTRNGEIEFLIQPFQTATVRVRTSAKTQIKDEASN